MWQDFVEQRVHNPSPDHLSAFACKQYVRNEDNLGPPLVSYKQQAHQRAIVLYLSGDILVVFTRQGADVKTHDDFYVASSFFFLL